MGIRGLAWHVPCHVRCTCYLVRRRKFIGLGCVNYDRTHPKGYRAAVGYRAAAGCYGAVGSQLSVGYRAAGDAVVPQDTVPLRDAVRDIMPL